MAKDWKYKLGTKLGGLVVLAYLASAIIGLVGSAYGLDDLISFSAWYLWTGVIFTGLLILWFIPRPVDVMLLSPLAVYAGANSLGLTYTVSGIIVAVPLLITILLSLGRKE